MEAIRLPATSTMRLQLAAIIAFAWSAGLITTWQLHQHGIQAMVVRYAIALAVVYAAFLFGVRVWLWLLFAPKTRSRDDSGGNGGGGGGSGGSSGSGDSFGGGGGRSGGAGASSSWAEGGSRPIGVPIPVESAHASSSSSSKSSGGDSDGGGGAAGAGAFLIRSVFVIALIAICAAVGYIIYIGPHMLGDAAFNFVLAAGLARQRHATWLATTVQATWKPFLVILVATLAFALFAGFKYPQAHTMREVMHQAGWDLF